MTGIGIGGRQYRGMCSRGIELDELKIKRLAHGTVKTGVVISAEGGCPCALDEEDQATIRQLPRPPKMLIGCLSKVPDQQRSDGGLWRSQNAQDRLR